MVELIIRDDIDQWLDQCPEDVDIIEEFDDAIWVKVERPFKSNEQLGCTYILCVVFVYLLHILCSRSQQPTVLNLYPCL